MKAKLAITIGVIALVAVAAVIVLPLLATPSNCGGNAYALSACRQYAILTRLPEVAGKSEFKFAELEEVDRIWVARLATKGWAGDKDFLIRTNFTIPQTGRVVVIVCEQPFANIPQPTIWNLYRENPAHAVGYSDGNGGLISLAEYAALDLTGFASLSSLGTNSQAKAVQP